MDWIKLVVGWCEEGDKPSAARRGMKLSNYELLKDSDPWSDFSSFIFISMA